MGSSQVIPWYYYYFFGGLEPVRQGSHPLDIMQRLISIDPRSSRSLPMYLHTPELRQRPLTAQGGTCDSSSRRHIAGENSMWDLRILYVHLHFHVYVKDILMIRFLYFLACCFCVLPTRN
jgi:hypothetical protein